MFDLRLAGFGHWGWMQVGDLRFYLDRDIPSQMDQPHVRQLWTRTLTEVYRVTDGADSKMLLGAGGSTRFGCEDFYTDEEDGYTGGKSRCGGFTYASGERKICVLELGGDSVNRILVRVSTIDFVVYPEREGLAYERIMDELIGSVCAERLTQAWLDDVIDVDEVDLASALTPIHIDVSAHRTDPDTFFEIE